MIEHPPQRASLRAHRFGALPLVLALGVFLALAAYQLSLPGLHYDEAREAGLNAMQLIAGQPVTAFRGASVQLGPWALPLMVQDYIGALNVYLALPFLALSGANVVALRWLSLLTGALTLVLAWRVAYRLGGWEAAIVTVFLLAISPTFVFWSRQGIFVTNLTALLFMAGLLSGLRWWTNRRRQDLWLTAFLLGLGVYAKLLFAWGIVALVVVALAGQSMARRRRIAPSAGDRGGETGRDTPGDGEFRTRQRTTAWTWFVALACFLAPLAPLMLFNARTGGTLASLFGNLGNSYYGVNNAAYFANLMTRLRQLQALLRGDHLWYLGELFANPWASWIAGGLVAAATARAALLWVGASRSRAPRMDCFERRGRQSLAFLMPLALLSLVVAQSAFTVSDLFITHYALVYPLIPLAGGLAAATMLRGFRRDRQDLGSPAGAVAPTGLGGERRSRFLPVLAAVFALTAVVGWAAADLWTTVRYHRVLSISGGYSAHSDAIYRLAAYLDRDRFGDLLALDWGLSAPVWFLTAGRANPVEVFGYDSLEAPDAGFADRMSGFLNDPDSLYLAHMPDATVFEGRIDALRALAGERGLELEEEGRFAERSGHPLFVLYRAVPAADNQ